LKERKLREASTVKRGKRVVNAQDAEALKECERQINRHLRDQMAIEKAHKEDFVNLREKTKQAERIRLKDKVYRIDTELDQIMTCFKLSFANLCSFLLSECMNRERHDLLALFESFFQLSGEAILTQDEKLISLQENQKEQQLMRKLGRCMTKLNRMRIRDMNGRRIPFALNNC
jgi:hypothetical protein